MKMTSRCKIKIFYLLLLFDLLWIVAIVAVPSADDLIYVGSPELETIAEFENDTFSQSFIFKYENFIPEYIVACRIGSNVTFATRNPTTGKLVSVDDNRYDVVGGDIGTEGEFQVSLRGNINEQDGNCFVCGYATPGFVMETSCIRLRITKKPVYYLEQRPDIAITGDEVEIYCIVSGYPFPKVKFSPPFYLPIETRLMSLANETLRVIKYVSTINYIDISWNDEEAKCQVFTDDTIYKEKTMKIFVKRYNESIVYDDQTVSTIAIVCSILGAFLMVSMMLGIVMYMKKKNQREAYLCLKVNDECDDEGNQPTANYYNYNNYIDPKDKPAVPPQRKPQNTCGYPGNYNQKMNYKPTPNVQNARKLNTKTNCPPQNYSPTAPCEKIHYFPQQIINVMQKHNHHESKHDHQKCKNETQCKTPTVSQSAPPAPKKPQRKEPRPCEAPAKTCDKPKTTIVNQPPSKNTTRKLNVSTSAFV